MPKRNWVAINRLKDQRTMIAISLATDPKILACYERGFPHLFTDGDDEGPRHVPLSVFMEASEEYSRREYPEDPDLWLSDRHFALSWAGELYPHCRVPSAYQWGEDYTGAMPDFVLKQLVGQKAQAGLVIDIDGKKYVVLNINFALGKHPEIGSVFTEPPLIESLSVIDADFVDLDK